jgi:hypothetical protein
LELKTDNQVASTNGGESVAKTLQPWGDDMNVPQELDIELKDTKGG